MNKVFFIGGGNMARAIISGMDRHRYNITVMSPTQQTRSSLESLFPDIDTTGVLVDSKLHDAGVVVFAVKPQVFPLVLEELSSVDFSGKTVVSVMAGVTISKIGAGLMGVDINIIRTMPNTPGLIGKGVTGVYIKQSNNKILVENLFGNMSSIYYVADEDSLNKICAISGSGPAYFFAFIEALRNAGEDMGLPSEMATQMAIETALGAAELAINSNDDVSQLRKNVTSKGGTTQQALTVLSGYNLERIVRQATFAALQRGRELSKL
eukprot:TRINITY_DN9984_c0_g1_i1.p1 TRINITY_DN9984_c0_g1~~TRINITY_DN9984_c0_g1_i1.p1  ORF type:complete len:274 (-),score=43.80 TRINITY_DN9984_c0_g1_i1:44-841(-)